MTNDITNKLVWVRDSRALPQQVSGDGEYGPARGSRFGDLMSVPVLGSKMHALADEGGYFTAKNPTQGTGIAGIAAATTIADTAALMFLRNGASNDKRIYLDYILLAVTAAGTNGTNWSFAMRGDKGNTRYTSGGSVITPKNPNMGSARTPGIDTLVFGAIVAAAATSEMRDLHGLPVRSVIKVVGDKYLFKFGDSSPGQMSGIPLEGTLQANINIPCPPIVLDPGDSFLLHEAAASQSVGASYEFTMGFWVR